ncbi:SipW-dependent-type signal peptide-containing protein [Agromyces salentinus]|uniref:SipW-dependent-type signal peptide-containing protein n=1 Tax=Agromyces salentinus TaxID=269421 RepID=UPI00147847DF|nr:SipW-dependent-type signal peptide-containing protein [Agromyces salentinus]
MARREPTRILSSVRARRLHVVRLALAALVVVGIGSAITVAAWTDSVHFDTTVSSGTIELQGAVDYLDPTNPGTVPDGLDWQEFPGAPADSGLIARFVPPAIDFQNFGPGQTRSATVWLRNAGSLPVGMVFDPADPASLSWSGANLFPDPPDVVVTAVDRNNTPVLPIEGWVLRGGDWLTVTVTVSTPSDWAQENEGRAGSLELIFQATTDGVTTD